MNALLNTPKRVTRRFHENHGPMTSWTAEEFDLLQELLAIAWRRPVPRFRLRLRRVQLRLRLLTWTAAALPVAVLGSLLWVLFNKVSPQLESITDRVDDRCTDIELACTRAGDRVFVDRVGEACNHFVDRFDRLTSRLVRG
ncbi:hypothetical protein [Streptomyces sp. NPDC058084]|uniref:hypothetical protein n=1 Tax=Streptomyces sp. NPDC058084 TaxID=3346333 RepID=UPI0036E1AE87